MHTSYLFISSTSRDKCLTTLYIQFASYAGVAATFMFAVPLAVKVMHMVRTQVRKILAAMEGEQDDDASDDSNDDNPV